MAMLAIDVGYGYTKAVSGVGAKVCFPSVVAPGGQDALGISNLFGNSGPGHAVSVRGLNESVARHLVGEAARESYAASGFLGAEKPAEMHDTLLLTAAYLAGGGDAKPVPERADSLVVGLPLAFYRVQRQAVQERLEQLVAHVSVDGGEERRFSFGKVLVVPQGAGVVFAQGLPNGRGFAGVVDVGQYTTDYLLVNLETRKPLPEACGSLEVGCHLVAKAVGQAVLAKTGYPLPQRMEGHVLRHIQKTGRITFRGRELDFAKEYEAAVRDVAAVIARQVLSAWADMAGFVAATYLAGGGSLLMRENLLQAFPNAALVADPVFANALGYFAMLSGQLKTS